MLSWMIRLSSNHFWDGDGAHGTALDWHAPGPRYDLQHCKKTKTKT